MNIAENHTMNLPDEIWSEVFSYLPLQDRKNVRQICHQFYDACNTYYIQKNEEIAFYGNINTHSAIQCLCNSSRRTWNIKLCDLILKEDYLPFFEKHGADIHSLILDNCFISCGILQVILEPCTNLRIFTLILNNDYKFSAAKQTDIGAVIEAVQKSGIVCTNVEDFTLELTNYSVPTLTNKTFISHFRVFPNIKKFDLTLVVDRDFEESNLVYYDATSNKLFSASCIYDQIISIRHLEKLALNIWKSECDRFSPVIILNKIFYVQMEKLKNLSFNCKNIFIFFESSQNYEYLTHLDCDLSEAPVSTQILNILNFAPRLQSLTLRTLSIISKKSFVALVNSQLKTLNILSLDTHSYRLNHYKQAVSSDFAPLSIDSSLLPNYILKNLNVQTNDYTLLFLFSKYFRCLENMFFNSTHENILYNIFKYQMKLRSLTLLHCERYPSSRIRPRDRPLLEHRLRNLEIPSYSQLSNITHLCIVDNISLDLCKFMLSKFVFSKLKSLTIRMEDSYPKMNCDIEAMWQLIQKSTQLEYLKISWRTIATFQQWLTLFEALPKLRHFSCTDSCLSLFEDSEYRQLFHSRSSLRTVYHYLRKKSEVMKYVFDILTNKITSVRYTRKFDHIEAEGVPRHYYNFYK